MVRVLAFCDYLSDPLGGGAEIVTAEVYRRLAATDTFDITVLTGVSDTRRGCVSAGEDLEIQAHRGLDLSRLLGAQLSLSPGLIAGAIASVRRTRPDVLHASSIHFFGSVVAAAVARATRIPLVTTAHLSGLDALPPRTRRLAALHERTLGRFILSSSRSVIAVSNSVADHIAGLGVATNAIHVIENGVDSSRFVANRGDGSVVTIAFVGRLIDNKGPLLLADAFRNVVGDHLRLVYVGDGPQRDDLAERVRDDPRVRLLGHRDDVAAILGHADIFVRPSTTEGRSLALLEAMAAECAVVASDIPANAELIRHGDTGMLVAPEDTAALTTSLETLVHDADLRARLGERAREVASASSWDDAAAATGVVLEAAATA